MLELKQRISEGIVEGAKQQAANLLVKKEKVWELASEKASSSSEITSLLEKTMDESQERYAHPDLGIFIFLGFVIFWFLGMGLLSYFITRYREARRARRTLE